MLPRKKGWENRLEPGTAIIAYAQGATWERLIRHVRQCEDAGVDIWKIMLAEDVAISMLHEYEVEESEFEQCYIEICGYPAEIGSDIAEGNVYVMPHTRVFF